VSEPQLAEHELNMLRAIFKSMATPQRHALGFGSQCRVCSQVIAAGLYNGGHEPSCPVPAYLKASS
jgi:hypothetical protein